MGDGADMAREAWEDAEWNRRVGRALDARRLLLGGGHWITKDGRTLRIREMQTDHLVNVCRMLERNVAASNAAEEERVSMHAEDEPPDPDGPRLITMDRVPPYVGARAELHYRDPERWPADLDVPVDGPGKLGGEAHQAKLATLSKKRDANRE